MQARERRESVASERERARERERESERERAEEARRRFHHQDERLNDSNRGIPVRTTWAIGPIPYSTTPRQISDALDLVRWSWNHLEGDPPEGPPNQRREEELVRPGCWALRNRRQRWNSPLPIFVRAEMSGPTKARTDVTRSSSRGTRPKEGNQNGPGNSTSSTEKKRGKAGKAQRPTRNEKKCKYGRTRL